MKQARKTRLSKSFSILLATSFSLSLSGCGPSDADKISDAQTCLNTASSTTASSCVAMVDGIASSGASLIRCSGAFIEEGFGDSNVVGSALGQLDSSGSGSTGSMAMMGVLAFQSNASMTINLANAQDAQTECVNSGSPGLIFLSGIVLTATKVVALLGTSTPGTIDQTTIDSGLQALISGSSADQAVVGGAILGIYDSTCQNGGTTAGNYCQQFQSVVDQVGTAPADVGAALAHCYTDVSKPAYCQGF